MTITFIPARNPSPPPAVSQGEDATVHLIAFVTQQPEIVFLVYLSLINAFTWYLFWVDKQRAIHHQWRVQESVLLFLAFLGGTIGAFAARRVFRHKTRKQPFVAQLYGISRLQIACVTIAGLLLFIG